MHFYFDKYMMQNKTFFLLKKEIINKYKYKHTQCQFCSSQRQILVSNNNLYILKSPSQNLCEYMSYIYPS